MQANHLTPCLQLQSSTALERAIDKLRRSPSNVVFSTHTTNGNQMKEEEVYDEENGLLDRFSTKLTLLYALRVVLLEVPGKAQDFHLGHAAPCHHLNRYRLRHHTVIRVDDFCCL